MMPQNHKVNVLTDLDKRIIPVVDGGGPGGPVLGGPVVTGPVIEGEEHMLINCGFCTYPRTHLLYEILVKMLTLIWNVSLEKV